MRPKDYTIEHLLFELSKAGVLNCITVSGGLSILNYWQNKGKLKLRKRPHSGYRVVNDEEIRQIVESFSPGGAGWWTYNHEPIIY